MKKVAVLIIVFIFLPILTFAEGYQPLSPIPSLSGGSAAGASDGDIAGYLSSLYSFGVAAAAGLAVIMVILGGIQYITSVAGEGKSGGKDKITSAILGLLLALGSYIILNTINKDLLKLSFEFKPGDALKSAKTVAPVTIATTATGTYTIAADGTLYYNSQSTGYRVDGSGNIIDGNGNPASYINDTPLNVTNFAGSFRSDSSGNVADNAVGSSNSSLANLLAQSATNAYGQNLGQGTSQRVACASTACSIFNNAGLNYGNIPGTAQLGSTLSSDPRFTSTILRPGTPITPSMFQQGDIFNTATSKLGTGHIGVVDLDGLISNNDSDTGLVKKTTVSEWNAGVVSRPGLITTIYRAK